MVNIFEYVIVCESVCVSEMCVCVCVRHLVV